MNSLRGHKITERSASSRHMLTCVVVVVLAHVTHSCVALGSHVTTMLASVASRCRDSIAHVGLGALFSVMHPGDRFRLVLSYEHARACKLCTRWRLKMSGLLAHDTVHIRALDTVVVCSKQAQHTAVLHLEKVFCLTISVHERSHLLGTHEL